MSFYDLNINVHKDDLTGFALTKTLKQQVYQKFKTLLLLNPGERIGGPRGMGIGLRKALFASNIGDTGLYSNLSNAINNQVREHMKYLEIEDIEYNEVVEQPNTLYIKIMFAVPVLDLVDQLIIKVNESGEYKMFFGPDGQNRQTLTIETK